MVEAIDWKDVLGWHEEQVAYLRQVGYGYLRQGFYDRVILYFEALVVIDSENLFDNQVLGALYLQSGHLEQALPQLTRALTLDPTHLSTQLNRCKALLSAGIQEEGLVLARQLALCEEPVIRPRAEALLMAYE